MKNKIIKTINKTRKYNLMKWTILVLVFSLSFFWESQGQTGNEVSVNVMITPPYSPYLYDYQDKIIINLTNLTDKDLQLKLVGHITGDNGLSVYTDANYFPPQPIELYALQTIPIIANSSATDFLDRQNLVINADPQTENQVITTGILPEGVYTFCVQAVDYQSGVPYSMDAPAGCTEIYITYVNPPVLIGPACDAELMQDATGLHTFTWTPPVGYTGPAQILYDLYIAQVFEGQNPYEAISAAINYGAGDPIVRQDLMINSYTLLPGDKELQEGQLYAWAVVARDQMNNIVIENSGASEVCTFMLHAMELEEEDTIIADIASAAIAEQEDSLDQLANTRVTGKLLYKFPSNNPIVEAPPSVSNSYAQVNSFDNLVHFSGNASNSPAFGFYSTYMTAQQYQVQSQNPEAQEEKKKSLKKNFNVSQDGAQPLANVKVELIMQMVANVTYYETWTQDAPEVNDGQYVIKESGYFLKGDQMMLNSLEAVYQEDIKLIVGSVLATANTDSQGNFDFFFNMKDSTGYIIDNLTYFSKNDVGSAFSCEQIEPINNTKPVGPIYKDDKFNPTMHGGQHITPALQQSLFLTGSGGGNALHMINLELLKAVEKALFSEGCPLPRMRVHYGMPVLRLRVSSPYYCSPDQDIIVQPGEVKDVGTLVSFVQSYNLNVTLKSDSTSNQAAGMGKVLEGSFANIQRPLSAFSTYPEIPKNEGEVLNITEENNQILSEEETDGQGVAYFSKLVRHAHHTQDHYWIKGFTSEAEGQYRYLPGLQQYPGKFNLYSLEKFGFPLTLWDPTGINSTNFPYNSEYAVQTYQTTLILEPNNPTIIGELEEVSNIEVSPGKNFSINLALTFSNKQTIWNYITNENGAFRFEDIPLEIDSSGEIIGPICHLFITKQGYQTHIEPITTLNWGDLKDVGKLQMFPLGDVAGYVQDEFGKPVESLVRIGDGAYYKTEQKKIPFVGTERQHFNIKAEKSTSTTFFVHPFKSDKYFADTIFNINTEDSGFGKPALVPQELNPVIVYEKVHRPLIEVLDGQNKPVEGARVWIGDEYGFTDEKGQVSFRFSSSNTVFPLIIKGDDESHAPLETSLTNDVSKKEILYTYQLAQGYTIKGMVTGGPNQEPVAIARVFIETSYNNLLGVQLIETDSKIDGSYELKGVPLGTWTVHAVKSTASGGPLYIGQEKTIAPDSTKLVGVTLYSYPDLSFNLEILQDVNLTGLWGFDVEVEGLSPQDDSTYLMRGALVNLPENDNFKLEKPEQRLTFSGLLCQKSPDNELLPTVNQFASDESFLPLQIYGQFSAELKPSSPVLPYVLSPRIEVEKGADGKGVIKGSVRPQLYSFSNSLQKKNKSIMAIHDSEQGVELDIFKANKIYPFQTFGIAALEFDNSISQYVPSDAYFKLFDFEANADHLQSFVDQDGFHLHTFIHTAIPKMTPSDLNIELGEILINKESIQVEGLKAQQLSFNLETWIFKSKAPWYFDLNTSRIVIPEGVLETGIFDVPFNHVQIGPKQLLTPNAGDLQEFLLGGVANLIPYDGTDVFLQYDSLVEKSWRLAFRTQGDSPVGYLESLPGFDKKIVFANVDLYANGSKQEATLKPKQKILVDNVLDFETSSTVTVEKGSFFIDGQWKLKLPLNDKDVSTKFKFSREGNEIVKELKSMPIYLEGPGYVHFNYTGNPVLTSNLLEVQGEVVVTEDSTANASSFKLDQARFRMTPNMARVFLEGTNELNMDDPNDPNESKGLEVVAGEMKCTYDNVLSSDNSSWENFWFDAHFKGFTGLEKTNTPNRFTVHGAVSLDDGVAKVEGIETPFGGLNLVLDFKRPAFHGDLFVPAVPMGVANFRNVDLSVDLNEKGFALYGNCKTDIVPIPILHDIGSGFLLGYYEGLESYMVDKILAESHRKKMPFKETTIKVAGLFTNFSKSFIPSDLIDFSGLSEVGAEVWTYAGFPINITQGGYLYFHADTGIDFEVCSFCVGFMGEAGMQFDGGTDGLNISGCGRVAGGLSVECFEAGGTISEEFSINFNIGTSGISLGACWCNDCAIGAGSPFECK